MEVEKIITNSFRLNFIQFISEVKRFIFGRKCSFAAMCIYSTQN